MMSPPTQSHPLAHLACTLVFLVACGKSATQKETQSVGTYIGGGSMLTGSSACTYAGDALVGSDQVAKAEAGPRFIFTPGDIVKTCGSTTTKLVALKPTGAKIVGPKELKSGATSDLLQGHFVAGSQELGGEGDIRWQLASNCQGIAEFSPVLGSQDTGGADRSRTLLALKAGTCTVNVKLETGSALYESYKPQSFQAEHTVTIK